MDTDNNETNTMDSDLEVVAQLCGSLGAARQIHAFRDCWGQAQLYLKALHQAAIGCASNCSGNPKIELELRALLIIIRDITVWADASEGQLKALENLLSQPDENSVIH